MGYSQDSSGRLTFNNTPSTVGDLEALSARAEEVGTSQVASFDDLAAIEHPVIGHLVWVDGDQLLYRYTGSDWAKLVYDTGWLPLGLSGVVSENSGNPAVCRIGKEVSYRGTVAPATSWQANSSYPLLAQAYPLRADVRPKQAKYLQLAGNTGSSSVRSSTLSDGTITFEIGTVVPAYVALDGIHYPVV